MRKEFICLLLAFFGFFLYSCGKQEKAQVSSPDWDDFSMAKLGEKWQIRDENIQMMAGRSDSSEVIHVVSPGQEVKILGQRNPLGWILVETLNDQNFRGWVKDTFVEKALLLEKAVKATPTPSVVAGLSLAKKKQIFYDLVALQDKYMYQDPYNTQKQHDAYGEIAKRHNVSEKKVSEIAIEGIKKRWPTPPIK